MNTQGTIDIDSTTSPSGQPSQAVAIREPGGAVGPALEPVQIPGKPPMTAAQGKVDAVAALTMAAYERAATLQLTKEETEKLRADFTDEAFKPGAGGKEHLIYIEHAFLRERFTEVFGLGQWALIPRNRWAEPFKTQKGVDGSRVYVEAMLVVRGCFVGEAIGEMEYYPSNGSQNYGDAVEGAKTAAFRRCAKEFGVGLQAWKKDFGDGWWQRKRGQGTQGQRQGPARGTGIPPASQRAAQAPAAQPAPAPAPDAPRFATDATRDWMLKEIGEADAQIAAEYFEALGQLLNTENLTDLPLRFVPVSKEQMRMLKTRVEEFKRGDQAGKAFEPNPEADPPKEPKKQTVQQTGKPAPQPDKPIEIPRDPPGPPPSDPNADWFLKIVVPIPHKGERRDDYLKHPDTIGSLYEARHGTDDLAQEARQRLWGFVTNYEPKPWTGKDGQERPPSKTDVQFREALDAFAVWFERNHPGEKL